MPGGGVMIEALSCFFRGTYDLGAALATGPTRIKLLFEVPNSRDDLVVAL